MITKQLPKTGYQPIVKIGSHYEVRLTLGETETDYIVIAIDHNKAEMPTETEMAGYLTKAINSMKSQKRFEVQNYAGSEAKRFRFHDKDDWFDSETRTSIMQACVARSLNSEPAYLHIAGEDVRCDYDTAVDFLMDLELYASRCKETVNALLREIDELETIEEVQRFSFIGRFPEIITFNPEQPE